jgi:hypothetical protein
VRHAKKYYSHVAAKDGEAKKDGGDRDDSGFPAVENLIFGGPTVDMSTANASGSGMRSSLRRRLPPLSFLEWSGDAITFSREDHPNRIPNPGHYPLVVDRVISNLRFTKVLMDGGSSLNILCAHTLWLMGIGFDQLRPARRRSIASCQTSESSRSGRSTCQFGSARRTISARKSSPSRW